MVDTGVLWFAAGYSSRRSGWRAEVCNGRAASSERATLEHVRTVGETLGEPHLTQQLSACSDQRLPSSWASITGVWPQREALSLASGSVASVDDALPSFPIDEWMWTSSNPRFGVIRNVLVDGRWAVRLDDLNSDFREVELTVYQRRGGVWDGIYNQDDVDYPRDRPLARFDLGEIAGAYGQRTPGSYVTIGCLHETRQVRTDATGWWLFVCPLGSDADDDPWTHWRSLQIGD